MDYPSFLHHLRSQKFEHMNIFLNAHVVEISQYNIRDNTTRTSRDFSRAVRESQRRYLLTSMRYGISVVSRTLVAAYLRCNDSSINMDEFNDFAGTSIQELPDSIDLTNKIFRDEINKYMPVLKGSGLD